uniref:Uncharacterized protein n=1 Tax=Ixodes ricinus TaxID=34613 RepID=A0A6B0UNA3_IXORI
MTRPQPCSQGMGLLGLCSQASRCDARQSSFTMASQPNWALSQDICSRARRLRRMRGTGFSWAAVIDCRSTGHVCCRDSHWRMQPWQKACSHCGAGRYLVHGENFFKVNYDQYLAGAPL